MGAAGSCAPIARVHAQWESQAKEVESQRRSLQQVRRHLDTDDQVWHWRSDVKPQQVAYRTLLVHPETDKMNEVEYKNLRDTYDKDKEFEKAILAPDVDVDAMRFETKYLYPEKWYDWVTPNFLVGNRVQRFFGDTRAQVLDDKVDCVVQWSKAEAHRNERNGHRQRLRLAALLAVYLVLFALPVGRELWHPVTSEGCHALAATAGALEDPTFYSATRELPCRVRPHSGWGFVCALLMLCLAKAATASSDLQWWRDQFPAAVPDGQSGVDIFEDLEDFEREWHVSAPLAGIALCFLCLWFGFSTAAAFVGLWAAGQLAQDAAKKFFPHQAYVTKAVVFVRYLGELVLACVNLWGAFVAGMAFVIDHHEHFQQGWLEVVPVSPGQYVIQPEGAAAAVTAESCLLMKPEEVVPVAYAYFGPAHMALFMLGAATLSLAELLKLKKDDSYVLKGWVDIEGLLDLNDALAQSEALGQLKQWREDAEKTLDEIEESIPSSIDDCLQPCCMDAGQVGDQSRAQAKLNKALLQIRANAETALDEIRNLPPAAELTKQQLPLSKEAEQLTEQVREVVLAVDLETVSWPGVVTALGFAFWDMMEGTVADPCLPAPEDGCSKPFHWTLGWTGICGTDEYLLGMQTVSLLYVLLIGALLVASRAARAGRAGFRRALEAIAGVAALTLGIVLILATSGLSGMLRNISASALPFLPSESAWLQGAAFVCLLVGVAVLLAIASQGLDGVCAPVRFVYPGSLGAFTVFLLLLGYTIVQGAFDFQTKAEEETSIDIDNYKDFRSQSYEEAQSVFDSVLSELEGARSWLPLALGLLSVARLLALWAGKVGLMRPSHAETDNFVNRALRPEALSIVESVGARASSAIAAVGGEEEDWAKEWTKHDALLKHSLRPARRPRRPRPPPLPHYPTPPIVHMPHPDFEGAGFSEGGFGPPHGEHREGVGWGPVRPLIHPEAELR